jgi:hypothetical protein
MTQLSWFFPVFSLAEFVNFATLSFSLPALTPPRQALVAGRQLQLICPAKPGCPWATATESPEEAPVAGCNRNQP